MNIFARALIGFAVQAALLLFLCFVALWAIDTYAAGLVFASGAVVVLGMVFAVVIYTSTLAGPLHKWVKGDDNA